MFDGSLMF